MFVIAGLGNPGRKYEGTRHNCGFAAIDVLADRIGTQIRTEKCKGLIGSGVIGGQKVLLVKPQTYMNLSGECLRAVCDWYKVDPEEELIVICDDISLPPGHIRIRRKGSAGGHNGLKNIIAQLGTQNFRRVKIGVGEKPEGYDLADYVLGRFPLGERTGMLEAYDRASRAAAAMVTRSIEDVMNEFNTPKQSTQE
jgi:PTH1 family peptidyl-tRNA hydrolase